MSILVHYGLPGGVKGRAGGVSPLEEVLLPATAPEPTPTPDPAVVVGVGAVLASRLPLASLCRWDRLPVRVGRHAGQFRVELGLQLGIEKVLHPLGRVVQVVAG